MKMDPKTLAHRFGVAQTKRRRVEPQLDDVLRHFAPTRGRFQDRAGEEDTDLYDETGPVTLGEFSARFHQGATPTYSQWALLEADKSVPATDRDAVNKDLAEIREYAFEVIQDSNFVPEAGEFYQDLGMSTGREPHPAAQDPCGARDLPRGRGLRRDCGDLPPAQRRAAVSAGDVSSWRVLPRP